MIKFLLQPILLLLLLPFLVHAQTPFQGWESWYTVTKGNNKLSFYYEKTSKKKDKIHYQTKTWKKELGNIHIESLGAFSKDNEELTPLFYHLHSTFRKQTKEIEVNFKEKEFIIKKKTNNISSPAIKHDLPQTKKVFLSTFFQIWLLRNKELLNSKNILHFYTYLEDSIDKEFRPIHGFVTKLANDSLSKSSHSEKFTVQFNQLKSHWWLLPDGSVQKIKFLNDNTVVKKASKKEAESFFNEK
ncbi:MAG: hypothetical protein CL678_10175 [Bdellovibrionaceae bacterium]|nr:hypothetical protein [Pseudobdellovibrionaceae bacterium]